MGKMHLAVIILIILAFLMMPASAESYSSMRMDASQGYLRLDSDDMVTLTIHMINNGDPAKAAGVPVILNFKSGGDYVTFDKQLIITNGDGEGSSVIRLNPSNTPERVKLPILVMVEAVVTSDEKIRCTTTVYITSSGSVAGYVVNDDMSTITGANITVKTADGRVFPGEFYSSDGAHSSMGYYKIDNLPVGIGRHTIIASKNGYNGTIAAEAGYENIMQNVVIHGYTDSVDVTKIVTGNAGTPTPVISATPVPDTPARPTSMTTTILIAIALIALVYIGLKVYRRMF